jgi:DNA modification methylase
MLSDRIICGDCIEELVFLRCNGVKVQLTVTSPPYFNAREYSKWKTYEDYLSWLKTVFSSVYEITEDGRMCCVNVSPVIEARASRNEESIRYPIPFDLVHLMCKI